MITKEKLKKYAEKLMFRMSDSEYDTLLEEFDIILNQMELIGRIEGINNFEPMIFPIVSYERELRNDECTEELTVNDVLSNTKHQVRDQVKVPKVVE